ncbi:MAG TPA: PPC domain-containing DNA-binding protein [Gemmatimonadota bacterium]|nr:PPC domain-containing DNA-binding protein [Gemmatimonadota bacterium]
MTAWARRERDLLIVLARGTDLLDGLREAVREAAVESGSFVGLGAVEAPRVAWFDRYEQRYRETSLEGVWEIAGLTGNVTRYEDAPRIHAHVIVSDRSCETRAGHLLGGVVGVTCEIVLTPFESPVERVFDESLRLPLIEL